MGDLDRVVPLRGSSHGAGRAEPQQEEPPTWLPLDEVNRLLGIPLTSLRRYLDRHGRYLATKRAGKKIVIARSALPVLERIRNLYDTGRTVAAVEDDLGAMALDPARDDLSGVAEGPVSKPPIYLSPAPQPASRAPAPASRSEPASAGAERPTVAEMQRQVATLDRKLSEMQTAIENRDLMLRQILSAIVHVIEAHDNERRFAENERQIADDERDRQSAHRHQQLMLSLQEILSFTRRRRWLW